MSDDVLTSHDNTKKTPLPLREPREAAPGEEANNPIGAMILVGLLAFLWFGAGPRYFTVAMGLLLMIFLHELGHFMTARWTGMKATQFFLGFGPRIWSFRRGEVEYGIRAIPAGAFVRILGMNNLDPVEDPADAPRAYSAASFPRRMLVITAGSMMHFIQALILFVVLIAGVGVADSAEPGWTVAELSMLETGETPSEVAGLELGDRVLSVDGIDAAYFADFRDYLVDSPGEEIVLLVERDGEVFEATTTLAALPQDDGTTTGFLGIRPTFDPTRGSVWEGVELWGTTMKDTLTVALPQMFRPSMLSDLGSQLFQPTGAVDIASEEAERPISVVGVVRVAGNPEFDWSIPIFFLAIVNVFVGIFNLLPLLPLDGGHASIAIYERLRSWNGKRYQADVAKLLPVAYAVMSLLAFVFISTLYLDIARPIQ